MLVLGNVGVGERLRSRGCPFASNGMPLVVSGTFPTCLQGSNSVTSLCFTVITISLETADGAVPTNYLYRHHSVILDV